MHLLVVPTGSAGMCWENLPLYTVGTVTSWEKMLETILHVDGWILQLEDAEQRVGTVSPCPTAHANLAIPISWSYCLPAWHCMYWTDSLAMDLVSLWQKLSVAAFQESKYKKVLETVGCFYHVFMAMCRWEFSWLEVSSQPLAKLQAVGWVGCLASRQSFAESPSSDSSPGAADQLSSSHREAPSRMLLPLVRDTHPNQGAAGGRTGTSSWGAAGLKPEMCFCSTEDCCRKKTQNQMNKQNPQNPPTPPTKKNQTQTPKNPNQTKKPTFLIFSRNSHFPHFLRRLKNHLMLVPCDWFVEMPLRILRRKK